MTGRLVLATGPTGKMAVIATDSRRDSRVRGQAAEHVGGSKNDVSIEDIDLQSAIWRVKVKNPQNGKETTRIEVSRRKNGAILMAKEDACAFLEAESRDDLKCVCAEKIFTAQNIGLKIVVPIK